MDKKCPCGSGCNFSDCCGAIIEGARAANTAEQLMRSRYTAFTIADADYLMKSHHPATRNIKEKNEIKRWARSVKWIGLKVLYTSAGTENDNTGIVRFRALFLENGKVEEIYEESRFEKIDGEWLYLDGK